MDGSPVLLVSELYPPAVGGSAVLFENIYTRLHCPVTVLTDDRLDRPNPNASLEQVRRRIRTPWWGLSHPAGARHHLSVARAVRRLARRAGPGTIVHGGRILPEGVAARFAGLGGGPGFVCWAHGEDLATAMSSRELTWVTKWVVRAAAAAFANSQNTKTFLTRFGLAADRIHVVYPGVDCARFHPEIDGREIRARHGIATDDLVVLSVGRLQARKGHDVAIQAMARLAAARPAMRYLIVGAGEERQRLEGLVRSLGVGERVLFGNEVPDHELPRYYAACDIFLLANRVEKGDFEGFGIVFLEAAATGKPVIGGASGGVAEAVQHGETGLLVAAEDPAVVAQAIETLAASAELRQRLGRAGRERAEHRFSWEAAAATVERVHRGLAGSHASGMYR